MLYESDKYKLNSVRNAFHGPVNDVLICEDIAGQTGSYYTLLAVKDHTAAKQLLVINEQAEEQGRKAELNIFSHNGNLCIVFPYRKERPLEEFFIRLPHDRKTGADICANLILECISSRIAYPILYLILTQNQIHILRDGSIYFGYQLDLSRLDESKGEKECVLYLGSILQRIGESGAKQKEIGFQLLEKKLEKGNYTRFMELYKDVGMAEAASGKRRLSLRLKTFLQRNQDRLYRVLLVCCVIIAAAALMLFATQLIWGDTPLLRIFKNPFQIIGTQSLLQ